MREKLAALAGKYFDEIVRTASAMIQIPSPSGEEGAMGRYVEAKMRELGYDEVRVDGWGNVIGLVRGAGGGKSVMLNCHMDAVDEGPHENWQYPPFSGTVAEGAIWGRGASDTKGTFAIQLYAPYILRREGLLPKGDMYVAGVVHEEDTGFGSMMMAREGFVTDYAIVGEATENDIAVACRGRIGLEVTITGKSCHASLPEAGVNPFDFLGGFLQALREYKGAENPQYGKSLVTPTRITSSEKGTNVIPNRLNLSLDYRSIPGETNETVVAGVRAIAERCRVPGIDVEIVAGTMPVRCYTGRESEGWMGEPSFGIDESDALVLAAKAAVEEALGRTVKTKPWAFATDSGHFSGVGVGVIGYSPAEIHKCHTVGDNIRLDMLKEGIAGTLAIITRICN